MEDKELVSEKNVLDGSGWYKEYLSQESLLLPTLFLIFINDID